MVTERQRAERELTRRLVFANDVLRGSQLYQCDWGWFTDPETGEEYWRPKIADLVPHWESRGDLREPNGKDAALVDDSVIVAVREKDAPSPLPKGVTRIAPDLGQLADAKFVAELKSAQQVSDHAMQRLLWKPGLDLGWLDKLASPHATVATGLSSYAHDIDHFEELFGAAYDPFDLHPNWTAIASYLQTCQSVSSYLRYKSVGGEGAYTYWEHDDAAMAVADCTVACTAYVNNDWYRYGVVRPWGRRCDAGGWYGYAASHNGWYNGGSSPTCRMQLLKAVAGVHSVLAEKEKAAGEGNHDIRTEMVGTTVKYWRDGVEEHSVIDASVTEAGKHHLQVYDRRWAASAVWKVYDYHVYVGAMEQAKKPIGRVPQVRPAGT